MSFEAKRGGASRPGFRALTNGVLLACALGALVLLNTQIEVFSLGDDGPDARSFPKVVLWALVAAVLVRLVTNFRRADIPFGPLVCFGRILGVTLCTCAALWLMPRFGFFAGATLAGIAVALALGERRLMAMVGLPLIVAAIATFGGQYMLGIPLP